MKDIEKQLKQAIKRSKMSRYGIAKESGLTESQLSYFINDKRSLTLPAAAKLAKALGLELKPTKKDRMTRGAPYRGFSSRIGRVRPNTSMVVVEGKEKVVVCQ